MSHFKEREERNCLNCNAQLEGRFCHICGQENIAPKESFWHLLNHFFEDITHFDGKFFSSLKLLITRPGYLSREYMNGRRASYLNPVRMYVFTSALFFLIFFNFFKEDDLKIETTSINNISIEEIVKMDSTSFAKFTRNINVNDKHGDKPMTRQEFAHYADSALKNSGIKFFGKNYATKAAYDSAGSAKDNWLLRELEYKAISINNRYNHDTKKILEAFKTALLHSLPQMLFISLPLMALLLQLLYNRRKAYFYVNHAIFSIHLYIFIFIVMLVLLGLSALHQAFPWTIFERISRVLSVMLLFYEYKAMRNFYGQGRAKTLLKFFLLNLSFFFMIIFLFIIFLFFSMFKI